MCFCTTDFCVHATEFSSPKYSNYIKLERNEFHIRCQICWFGKGLHNMVKKKSNLNYFDRYYDCDDDD